MLGCLEHLVSGLDDSHLPAVAALVVANVAKILKTPHFQVADKCLALLQTLKMKEYIRRNSAASIRVLYPVLLAVVRDHWHEGLQRSAFDLQQWLKGLFVVSLKNLNFG